MIQEELVTLETAKLLKEKGFREDCMSFYTKDGLFKAIIYYFTQQNKSATAVIVVVVTNILI